MLVVIQWLKQDKVWVFFILCVVAPLMLFCDLMTFFVSFWEVTPPDNERTFEHSCLESSADIDT